MQTITTDQYHEAVNIAVQEGAKLRLHEDDAQSVAHDILMKATPSPRCSFGAWFRRQVKSALIDELRRNTGHRKKNPPIFTPLPIDLEAPYENADERIDHQIRLVLLTPFQRRVATLLTEGYSRRAIIKHLKTTDHQVRKAIQAIASVFTH